MKRILALSILLSFVFASARSQDEQDLKDIFYEAEFMLANEFYVDALVEYQKLYNRGMDNNANINYRIGVCYINLPGRKEKAIPFLQQAIGNLTPRYQDGIFNETQAPYDAYLYLGNAYRINNQLESAIFAYEKYKELLNKDGSEMALYADQQIEACNHAREAMENPVYYIRTNVGDPINTQSSDYNPVVSANEDVMVYMTSLKFYDAVKFSRKENDEWTEPINITPEIQSDGDQYANSLSADGTELYLNKADNFNSDIYYSKFEDGTWSKSVPISKWVNTKYYESHACVSADNAELFFASNRKGSTGGMDLYVSRRDETGGWGEPQNLGNVINTDLNEDHPFITKDGKSLFFASQGHKSLGGFDIFYSQRNNDGSWSKPVNLGYPINTTDDDMFYVPRGEGELGYQAIFADDSRGARDIYRYRIFPGEAEYLAYLESQKEPEPDSGGPGTGTGTETGGEAGTETGAETGTETGTETGPEAGTETGGETGQVTETDPEPGKSFVIQAIFFAFDESELTKESKAQLDILAEVLKFFKNLEVEITGHTDAKGTEAYNIALSERRAAAARKYLASKGIDEKRITTAAMGETRPVAINTRKDGSDSPKGRRFNRRVEFRIINLSSQNITIQEIAVPEELRIR